MKHGIAGLIFIVMIISAMAMSGCGNKTGDSRSNAGSGKKTGAQAALIKAVSGKLVNVAGQSVDAKTLARPKYVLLYFSAHWCPPCRRFTPVLVDFYKKNATKDNFEVILVSADRSEEMMYKYMREMNMPWPAVDYSQVNASGLKQRYAGPGIPCLVMLDSAGNVVSDSFVKGRYVGPGKVLDDLKRAIGK